MKRLFSIFLVLVAGILMLASCPASAQSSTNLAPNPSFEDGIDTPAGWDALPGNSGGNLYWDETVAHTGEHSVSIANVTNYAWTAMWRTADFIPISGLIAPDFSVWVKMAGPKYKEKVYMQMTFYKADGSGGGGFGKVLSLYYEDWTQVYFRADDPNGWNAHLPLVQASTYLHLQLAVVNWDPANEPSELTVWFDDVYFGEPIPPNEPPVVDAGADQTADEGDTVNLAPATFTDANTDDTHTATIDWGDTSPTEAGAVSESGGSGNVSGSHVYEDNDAYTVTVCVTDDASSEDCDTLTVTVNNVAPVVAPITAPVEPVAAGVPITASADFTDAGITDTHTAGWDWGDGITPGTVEQGAGYGTVTDSHTYSVPGVYTISLTVTDKDGGVGAAAYRYVVVYDPEGGFVTGGGWIESPEGAYTPDPYLTGKANFGFVSKYKKGANEPTGQTQFRFKAASLDFHSISYQWLVIAGLHAKYKGTGTINGEGEYGFMLTATDGQINGGGADKFRIKIWDKDTGETIYDNQIEEPDDSNAGTELGGGSIVIHQ